MHRAPANKKSGASPLPASISMDRASRHRTPETLSGQHPLCTCASSCPCTSSCRPRKERSRFQASSHDLPSSKIYAAQYTSGDLRCQIFQPPAPAPAGPKQPLSPPFGEPSGLPFATAHGAPVSPLQGSPAPLSGEPNKRGAWKTRLFFSPPLQGEVAQRAGGVARSCLFRSWRPFFMNLSRYSYPNLLFRKLTTTSCFPS